MITLSCEHFEWDDYFGASANATDLGLTEIPDRFTISGAYDAEAIEATLRYVDKSEGEYTCARYASQPGEWDESFDIRIYF